MVYMTISGRIGFLALEYKCEPEFESSDSVNAFNLGASNRENTSEGTKSFPGD